MNIILISQEELEDGDIVRLQGRRARHITDVLKAEPGARVRLGVVNGKLGAGEILSVEDEAVTLRAELNGDIPERPRVDLLLALPRPLVMKRLWSALPMMGVGRIILTNASRVERFYFDTHWLEERNYMPLMLEGLEQAGDTIVPDASVHRQLKVLLEDELGGLCPESTRVVAHPGDRGRVLGEVPVEGGRRVLLAIGPEGGWTEHELGLLADHGFEQVTMGPRRLRTEAACVAALSILSLLRDS